MAVVGEILLLEQARDSPSGTVSLTDTGATVTDSLAGRSTRPVTDTGVNVTDSTATRRVRPATDTAVTVTDSIFASETGGGTNFPVFVFDRAIGPLPVVLVPLG